ncbi:MAG: zinc-dependent alcohol dehydrogenase, partial [Acidimicrobiales bacterium]
MPERMPAAVLKGPGRLEVEDVPVPALGPRDVLVEVERCGVCGSDLHFVLEGWGRPGSVLGHEWTGDVAAVGAAVTRWVPGDAVIGGPLPRCGVCRHCRAGRPSLCVDRTTPGTDVQRGAFAQFVAWPEESLLARPPSLSARAAALVEPLAVALHGINRSQVAPGDRVLVSGAGPIGALSVAALRAGGVDDVIVVEPAAARRSLALEVGARAARTPADLSLP